MTGIKLRGRMGNQMFQFAFGYVHAKKKATNFFISGGSSKWLLDYFLLNGYSFNPFSNIINRIFYRLSHFKSKILIQFGHENVVDIVKESEHCDMLDGYFQSELFFPGYEKHIQKLFELKPKYKTAFEKKYKDVFRDTKVIAVHIRRTDYLTWVRDNFSTSPALPFSYVEGFLGKFDLATYKVIFVSDDIHAVKEHFGGHSNFHFESNDSIIDFQILLNADVLCLSNSSFSWWGAYLNTKTNKQVFAPEYWLGSKTIGEYPVGVICKDWQRLKI